MTPDRRRVEAIDKAVTDVLEAQGRHNVYCPDYAECLAAALDAYFAHTRFVRRADLGDGFAAVTECRLTPEPIE